MKYSLLLLCTLLIGCAGAAPEPRTRPATPDDEPRPPGYLGFTFTYHEPERGSDTGWMMVRHVVPDGPAIAAGLEPQMVVVAIDGRSLAFSEAVQLLEQLATIRPGDRVRLALGGQHSGLEVSMVATDMPPDALRRWRANFESPPR